MPIAVQGYTVRYRAFTLSQLTDTYRKIASLGYDGVEAGMGGHFISPEEDAALLASFGLTTAAAYADAQKPDEAMKRASAYGVQILGVPSVPGEMLNSPDGFYAYAARLNEWAKPYAGTGFRLQYHNHAQEFRNFPQLNGKAGMAILIEETDPDLVVFELDTHWMAAAGADPAQWISKVKGRIPLVHYKDYAFDWKAEDTGMGGVYKCYAEVGQGNINWPAVRDACRDAGVVWYCVEQDRTRLDEFASLKLSIDYMRRLGVE